MSGEKGGTMPGRRITMGAPNHCGVAEKSQKCHKYFLQSIFFNTEHLLPKDISFEYGWRQTCFLPRASFSLVASLGVVVLTTNHKPTLPSHKSLMGINFRWNILHENVKFYFKVVYPIEAHYIARRIFSVFVEYRI